jgi:hypothetical protein
MAWYGGAWLAGGGCLPTDPARGEATPDSWPEAFCSMDLMSDGHQAHLDAHLVGSWPASGVKRGDASWARVLLEPESRIRFPVCPLRESVQPQTSNSSIAAGTSTAGLVFRPDPRIAHVKPATRYAAIMACDSLTAPALASDRQTLTGSIKFLSWLLHGPLPRPNSGALYLFKRSATDFLIRFRTCYLRHVVLTAADLQ